MSQKEVKQSQILDRLKEGKISQQEAAQQMGISTRQARRLAKRYQREGLAVLISKKRGYASNPRLDDSLPIHDGRPHSTFLPSTRAANIPRSLTWTLV